jgi:hypothetical protein
MDRKLERIQIQNCVKEIPAMSMKVNTPDGWERNVGQIRFMSNPPNDVR